MRKPETETLAKVAVAFSGLVWGLFWMPLRALHTAGFSPLWSLMIFAAVPALMVAPLMVLRWRRLRAEARPLIIIGIATAAPLALYSLALLETGIIPAMMLFYLTPVWATLMERVFLGAAITLPRVIGIALAFSGMAVIFQRHGLPLPRVPGDWAALAAGIGWAAATLILRTNQSHDPLDTMSQNFAWTALLMVPVIAIWGREDVPSAALVMAQMWWLVPVILVVVVTGVYTAMWGAPKLSPGIVGILYMTEISAGTVTAALFSGEQFGLRELIGIALITLAGSFEWVFDLLRRKALR